MEKAKDMSFKCKDVLTDIDALIQSVITHSFNGAVIAGIKTYGYAVMNYLTDVQEQIFLKQSVPYTKVTYPQHDSNGNVFYINTPYLPQIDQAYFIKAHFIQSLTEKVNGLILITDASDPSNAFFVGDEPGYDNAIITRGSTINTKMQLAIDRLNDLIDTIEADHVDQS